MKTKNLTKTLIVLTLVAIMGIGVTAYAGKGKGKGNARFAQDSRDFGRYASDGSGYGRNQKFMGNLSEEEIAKLDEERKAFFTATRDLRQNIYQKRLELNSELAKKNTDSKKAAALQKELSGFEAQLDQKRTEHRISMGSLNPEFNMMGRGFHGKGNGRRQGNRGCW